MSTSRLFRRLAALICFTLPVLTVFPGASSPAEATPSPPARVSSDALAQAAAAALEMLDAPAAANFESGPAPVEAALDRAGRLKRVADLVAARATVDPWRLYQVWSTTGTPRMTAVLTALAQVGKPYRSMSKGPDSFDCSGLVFYSWAKAGLKLGADSESQIRAAKRRGPQQLEPGDLVHHPGHISLYLGLGEAIVHAQQTGLPVKVMDWYRDINFGSPI